MIYGYSRCSTNESKQDLQRQTREFKKAGAEIVFQEFEHGDAENKQELNKLLEAVRPGDTVVTLEVSRLSRSTRQLCELVETVKKKQICLQIVGSVTIDCRNGQLDPMTAAFLQMAGVFSELELKMIRERVKSGMANARAKGKQIGRPPMTREELPENFFRHYPLYTQHKITKSELSTLLKVSRPTLDRWIRIAEV